MLDLSGLQQDQNGIPETSFIRDTSADMFEQDVLVVSMKTPVIVDFWAPWCGPCQQLMPVLEKVIRGFHGQVHLVKVNIDEHPELAQALRVQSVPMVYSFFQGKPVDGFVGLKTESELTTLVKKLIVMSGGALEKPVVDVTKVLEEAKTHLDNGDTMDAMALYSTALDQDPENMTALSGIAWCFLADKDMDSVTAMVEEFTEDQKDSPEIQGVLYVLALAKEGKNLSSLKDIEEKLAKTPKSPALLFDRARRRMAEGDLQGAVADVVTLTGYNREWEDQKARQWLLDLFDALGHDHPITRTGRRQLSAVLFS